MTLWERLDPHRMIRLSRISRYWLVVRDAGLCFGKPKSRSRYYQRSIRGVHLVDWSKTTSSAEGGTSLRARVLA